MPLPFLRRMHLMPKKYPSEQRDRATRMVLDRLKDYPSVWAAAQGRGPKLGVGPETLRKWVVQAQVDQGQRGDDLGLSGHSCSLTNKVDVEALPLTDADPRGHSNGQPHDTRSHLS